MTLISPLMLKKYGIPFDKVSSLTYTSPWVDMHSPFLGTQRNFPLVLYLIPVAVICVWDHNIHLRVLEVGHSSFPVLGTAWQCGFGGMVGSL